MHRLFFFYFPVSQVLHRYQPALLFAAPHKLFGNISFIKSVAGCLYGFDARLPPFKRLLFCFHQLGEGVQQILLHKYFSRFRCFAFFTQVRQENFFTVRPLLNAVFCTLNAVGGLRLYGIARCQLHGRCQYFLQTHGTILL